MTIKLISLSNIPETSEKPEKTQLALNQLNILTERARENLQNVRAENTRRAYTMHWRAFVAWCEDHGVSSNPASPRDIVLYLNWLDLAGKTVATINSARSAISHAHRLRGNSTADNPARAAVVAETLEGFAHRAKPQKQAKALLQADLEAIRSTAMLPRARSRAGRPERPELAKARGRVDIALCQALRDAGLRRSEASELRWQDVEQWPDGSGRITIHRSKTNQTGESQTVGITRSGMNALLAIRPENPGPEERVFRLSPSQISRRVAAAARSAGLGEGFSGHSGRVGLARNMSGNGAPVNETMRQGRWRNADTVARYTRGESAGAALNWIG